MLVAEDEKPETDKTASAEDDAAVADLASEQDPFGDEEAAETAPVVAAAQAPVTGPKVPNFRGKTMRAVVEEASAQGFPVMLNGSGIARMQEPPPGSVLRPGERIRVQFAR